MPQHRVPPEVASVHEVCDDMLHGLTVRRRFRQGGVKAPGQRIRGDGSGFKIPDLQPLHSFRPGKRHIDLARREGVFEINDDVRQSGALRLVDCQGPREAKRHLLSNADAYHVQVLLNLCLDDDFRAAILEAHYGV